MVRALPQCVDRLAASRRHMLVCLVGVWFVAVIGQLTACFDMNADSARYLALARSLAAGRGYTLEGYFCRQYPPLFPLALSTVTSPNRFDYRPEKLLLALTALGAVLASYWLLAQRYEGRTLVVLSLLVAVAPALLRYCGKLRPDVPFFFLGLVFMAAGRRFWRAERIDWPMGLLCAAALAASSLMRTAGLAFLMACCLWLTRLRLWRENARRCVVFVALLLIVASPPIAGWMAWAHHHRHEGTPSYADFIRTGPLEGESALSATGVGTLLWSGARTIPAELRNAALTVVHVGGKEGGMLWAMVLMPLGLWGLVRRMRALELPDYVFCVYACMVLLWPWPQGVRFWLPVLPLMLGYAADGLMGFGRLAEDFPRAARAKWVASADRLLARARGRAAFGAAALLLAVGGVSAIGMIPKSWLECRRAIRGIYLTGDPLDVARFLRAPHEGPIVLAYTRFREVAPAVSGSGVEVVDVPLRFVHDPDRFFRELRQMGVTHLAAKRDFDTSYEEDRLLLEAVRLITADPESYPIVWSTREIRIFELPRPAR